MDIDISDPQVQQELLKKQHPLVLAGVEKLVSGLGGAKAFLVGGFVRDALLGLKSKDADIEVYGVEASQLEKILEKIFPKVNKVGKAFGIFLVPLGDGCELDVALPRRESKVGAGHRGFAIEGDPQLDPREAARRRDFTCNALLADISDFTITDYFDGLADLKSKILRVVDPVTFPEDPLRVFRAFQFVARFGLAVDEVSFRLMRGMVERGELSELSIERIVQEWKKLLLADQPSKGLELAQSLGVIQKMHPAFAAALENPGALDRLASSGLVGEERLIAALSVSLDKVDDESASAFLEGVGFGHAVSRGALHLRRELSGFSGADENTLRRLSRAIYPVRLEVFLSSALALGLISGKYFQAAKASISTHPEWRLPPNQTNLLSGDDLGELGLSGEKIGELIKLVEAARDRGEISTSEEALGLVKKILQKNPFS